MKRPFSRMLYIPPRESDANDTSDFGWCVFKSDKLAAREFLCGDGVVIISLSQYPVPLHLKQF